MYLRFYLDENNKRIYTFKYHHEGKDENGAELPTQSAHPARFSPDDIFQKQRMACK